MSCRPDVLISCFLTSSISITSGKTQDSGVYATLVPRSSDEPLSRARARFTFHHDNIHSMPLCALTLASLMTLRQETPESHFCGAVHSTLLLLPFEESNRRLILVRPSRAQALGRLE